MRVRYIRASCLFLPFFNVTAYIWILLVCDETAWMLQQEKIKIAATTAPALGKRVPNDRHAVSVSMPRWADVVGYERGDLSVHSALECGYPRFVYHPFVRKLFELCERKFAKPGERAIALPSLQVARECVRFLKRNEQSTARIHALSLYDIHAVVFPESAASIAKTFWQHCGWIVSSRLAEEVSRPRSSAECNATVQKDLADAVGKLARVPGRDVYLFPSGMAAIDLARSLVCPTRDKETTGAQFGFPYLDTYKLQLKFGNGAILFGEGGTADLDALGTRLAKGRISHVFTEFPCNPLLQSPPLPELSKLLRAHAVPLVVDETIGSYYNIDCRPYADIIVTSLTKFVSGRGNVAAGALILNSESPFYDQFHARIMRDPRRGLLWREDARVLLSNLGDFPRRMAIINKNAEQLAEFLKNHPKVSNVYYPKFVTPENYLAARTAEGGYGGLLSLVLKGGLASAARFYNALSIAKCPGLGTDFTTACPYTLLAHFNEQRWAASYGVSPDLVRVSVGLEDVLTTIEVFKRALRKA